MRRSAPLALALLFAALPALAGDGTKRLKSVVGQLAGVDGYIPEDDERLTQLREAAAAAGADNDADAAKTLAQLMLMPCKSPSVEVNLAAACQEALIGMTDAEAHEEVRDLLAKGKKNPQVALALAPIVGSWQEPASATSLAELLDSKNEKVVITAARALGNLKLEEGVAPLIEAFAEWEAAGGEPLDAIGGALYDITGLGLKVAADWEKWWKDSGESWDPSQRGKGEGATSERPKNFQSEPPPSMFESMEVRSRRVVLIMDTSGSMHIRQYIEEAGGERGSEDGEGESLAGPPPLPKGVDPNAEDYKPKKCTFRQCPAARGNGECPSDQNLPDYYSRMARLSRAAQRLVTGFSPKVRFNMVAFSNDARTWKGKDLVSASPGNKKKAVDWLKGLRPDGATAANSALELAFEFKDADTFVFVTDGAPTNKAGRPYPPERWRELLDQVKQLNKTRGVKIDVIAIAEGHTEFATGLAIESGGQYAVVD